LALPNCSFPTIQIHDFPKTNRHMIEEELAPVYTNAPEETPSPELPQMPIAGGIGEEFGYAPLVEEAKVAQQKELDVNSKLHEVNVENKRRELSAIKGGMMEREDHSPEEKAVAVQNWITKSSGRLPKSHTEMRFGMDRLWKRAGKEGLAPSYDAVFDVVKERFVADKMEADEEQKYFEAGAKSKFSPDKYSWSQSIAQQDIDPDRLKILKAAYNQGAEAQTERYSPAMVNKINEYMEAANSVKTTEKVDKDVSPLRDKDFLDKKELDTTYDDIIDDMVSYTKNMSSEDKGLFVAGLRERIAADPDKNAQASDFFSQFGLNMKRSGKRGGDVFVRQGNWLKNLFHEANVNASEIYAPYVPYGQLMHSYFEQEYKDQLHKTNMKSQLSEMLYEEYDPIQPLARKDTMLGLLEEGILYQSPQVAASIVVPLVAAWATAGASAWVQVAGGAVSLSSLLTQSASEISESQRKGYLHSGMGFDEASEKSRGLLNRVWAVPHAAIGMLQVKTFTRKIPYWDKVMSRMDATIRNRALRFGSKAAATATAETIEEWTQDAWTETLKELSHAIDGEMDNPEWFGEGAFFDDFWAKSIVTFSSLGGLSMASAAGGLSVEDRAAAWAELPPLLRQAAGHQQKDIEALSEAKTPREKVKAYIDAEKNKDGQSPQVAEAITRLEETAASQALEIQDAQNKGLFPKSEVEMLDGKPNIKVFDPETNDIIIETDSFVDATAASFDWWGKKEEDFKDEFIYVKSMFEAATMLSQQAPELVQRLSLGEQMTDTRFKEQGADAARSIAEEAKRNEMINGGDGSMARLIFGTNQVQREGGQTRIINGLFQGATVETLLHEAGHGFFKKGISDGTIDFDDTVKLLKRVDKAFQGRFTKAIKFKGSERPAESMRLLPDTDKPTFKMVDEGMAQLYSALILGEGKLAPYRKLLNDSMSAHARSAGKSTIANFISAMRYYFNLALSRAVALKGMVRRGEIDQKDLDKVRSWMQGTTVQEEIAGEAKKEFDTYGIDDTAFSTGKPYKDRSGDEAGEPLTETEIKEGIEDESGTLADIEIDDEAFSDELGTSFSTSREFPVIKRSSLAGKSKFAYFSDWTRVGVYKGLNEKSGINIDLQGGALYPYIDGHKGKAGWAFTTEGMFSRFQGRVDSTDGIGLTTLYGKDNLRANPTFLLAYVEELKYALESGQIAEQDMLTVINKARTQVLGLSSKRKNKDTGEVKVKHTVSRESESYKTFSNEWTSVEEFASAMESATFEIRGAMFSTSPKVVTKNKVKTKVKGEFSGGRLASQASIKSGMPDVIKMIDLFADPMFDGAEYGTVVGAIQFEQGQEKSSRAKDIGAEEHMSYPIVIKGEGIGLFDSFVHINNVVDNPKNKKGHQLTRSSETSMAGVSFSVGRAEITPTANTQVFPTADGVVVGEASFSIGAWHGTPHDVDEQEGFSTDYIGTGEGAQAYGWGLYFAESEGVAKGYAKASLLSGNVDVTDPIKRAQATLNLHAGDKEGAISNILQNIDNVKTDAERDVFLRMVDAIKSGDVTYDSQGSLYQVELNVEQDELLDWDKPLSEQSEKVQEIFAGNELLENLEGSALVASLGGGKQASEALAAAGIKGIKYLDGTSRKTGEGTYNYVIFDGKDITIKEENGRKVATASFSIGAAQDADYLAAVEAGDTAKQQAMVDERARSMGYNALMKLYHGTKKLFGRFNSDRDPNKLIYFSKDRKMAETYPRGYGGHRNPEADVQKRLDDARQESREYVEGALEELGAKYGENDIPQNLVDDVFEKEKAIQRDALDGMTLARAQSEMGIRVIEGYVRADKIFEPANWREFAAEIMESIGVKSESEIDPQMMRMIEEGNYIVWENPKVVDAVLSKYDAMTIQESSGKEANTIAFRDPSQIKSADPVTYDSDGNVIPLSQRFDAGRDEISYSQGWQPEIRESILTNVESRMSTPQMKAEVIGDIQRRVQKLINDRRSFEKGMVVGDKTAKGAAKRIRSMIVTYEAILLALPTDIRGKMGSIVTIVDPNSEKQVLEFFDKKLNKLEKVVDRWVYGKFNVSRDRLFKRALAKPKAGEKDKGKLVGEMGAVINRNFEAAKEAMDLSEAEVDGKVAEIDKIIESKLAADTLTTDLENELESKKNLIDMFGNWKNLTNSDREAALKFGWREFEYAYLMSTIEKARRREELAMKADELIKATGIPMEDIEKEADKRREGMGRLFGRIKAARYGFYDFEQVMSSVFPDAKQVVDKVIQEQQADAQFHDRMKEHQEGVERFFGTLVGDSFLSMKALKLQDKMQTVFFKVEGGGIKRELTQMQMIQARLMWRQEDGRRHMENWADEEKGQTNYSQEFMDALEGEMIPESKSLENYLISQYELEYDRLNAVFERMYGVSLPKNLFYSPLTVDPLQDISDKATADPLSGQDISMMGSYNPSLLRRSKTAAAKPAFRDALATFYAHKNQIEYWMAYAEFVRELRSIIGNRDVRDAVKAKGGEEAVEMLKKWVNALDAGGLKSSALASQLNSFIGRSVNRTSSAILAGRLSTLAIQSTQAGAALAQMPTKDYVWRMGKLLSGNLEFAEAFNSKFIQRRLREAPPAVKMAMQGMASGSPTIAKAAAQKLGTLISGADAFFTAGTYAIIYDYLTTKKGMESAEAHTEATRLTEQVAQPTRMARRSMVELQQSQIALSKLSWAFASETRQKIALSAYRWDSKFTLAEKTRAIAVTFGFGGVFAQIVRSVGADLRDDDDDEIFDEKYWNPARMALKALLDPLTGVPIYGDLLQSTIMGAAKVAGVDTGYIFDNDSMISSVKDFPKAIVNLYGTASDLITGDDEIEIERLVKDVDKVFITMSPFFDTPAALSSFSHLVRDLFMIGKNAID